MSLELLEQLESRVQNALDTMELMQLELEEERQRSGEMAIQQQRLEQENQQLRQQLAAWHSKVEGLLGRLPREA
ncbi:cell division protein ZapB [Ferrimonas balearica]|uniref:cell division protein ZapB n=1 Tax=Ferrimonas balearica TaxID=44012 RepID=UPI001C9926B8|nr:cell division protein ZapB [Ferrimonas balearica]MBY5993313.1 cell division protein ZapB [Ferrimonas balearica]